jgi:hypothetical protein
MSPSGSAVLTPDDERALAAELFSAGARHCTEEGLGDFDITFAYEAVAHAAGIAGDADQPAATPKWR